jgi:NAD-dependent deacetylase
MFGDALAEPDWTLSQQACENCDTMLIVGTSGQVWPAAGLPLWAKERGVKLIEVNPQAADFGGLWLQGTATEVVPRLVQAAFGK